VENFEDVDPVVEACDVAVGILKDGPIVMQGTIEVHALLDFFSAGKDKGGEPLVVMLVEVVDFSLVGNVGWHGRDGRGGIGLLCCGRDSDGARLGLRSSGDAPGIMIHEGSHYAWFPGLPIVAVHLFDA
jgi:hypothetical protein